MARSILQDKKYCYICGTSQNLHRHHIFYGSGNRKLSETDGCVVYLCQAHHTGERGVHFNKKLDLSLKRKCEQAYLKQNNKTIDDFIQRYGKNYL